MAIVSGGALPRDAGKALCLPCLKKHPEVGLGQRIQAFRLDRGLMQKELAHHAGVAEDTIRNYEEDLHRARAATQARLARALGVPSEALKPGGPEPRKRTNGRARPAASVCP
jgi:transcriptional regulator with XRE-family HTH domain